jgi:hypothetical protein
MDIREYVRGVSENVLAGSRRSLPRGALFIPESESNLLSVGRLCDKGKIVVFDKEKSSRH